MLRCGAPTHFYSPHLPTLTFPYISPYLPHTPSHFPTPPFIPLPTSLLPPPTPQHIFLLSPHLPSPSQSVAKLLWQSYHVAKLLATLRMLIDAVPVCYSCQNLRYRSFRSAGRLLIIYQYIEINVHYNDYR